MKTMNCTALRRCLVVFAVTALTTLQCVPVVHPHEADGGDISVVDNKVCGVIYDSCGRPADGVSVVMRSNDYLPEIGRLGKRRADDGFFVCSTRTDRGGQYRFTTADSIPRGYFTIEARDSSNNCVLIGNVEIDSFLYFSNIDSSLATEFTSTLRPPGTIQGTIQPIGDSISGLVLVYGLENYTEISQDGSFILENVPPGNLRLQIIATYNGNRQNVDVRVATHAGDTATIDTLHAIIPSGNGNTGGTPPAGNQWYTAGDTVVVPGNSGNLIKTGYAFTGWNTAADGSGVTYYPGDTLIVDDAAIVLHAQWAGTGPYRLTIIDSGNGKTSGSDSVEHGIAHSIFATPDGGFRFVVWRVVDGSATIADSTAKSTTVILENGDAVVEGVFRMITFQKTFGGSGQDEGSSVLQTPDGGFVIAGSTSSFSSGGSDVYLIKATADGDIQWTRTFGGDSGDGGCSMQQTSDGGYIIAGYTLSSGAGESDVYLIKTDADGNAVWTKTFGGASGGIYDDYGNSVQQIFDGGFVIAGLTSFLRHGPSGPDFFLIKTDTDGNAVWTRTVGVGGCSVLQTSDAGFVSVGYSEVTSAWPSDVHLIKTDADGNVVWTKTFWGDYNSEEGRSVWQTTDGGLVITGSAGSEFGLSDVLLIKTDADGNEIWAQTFGEANWDYGFSVQQTSDGGFIIAGLTYSSDAGSGDVLLIKTDADGNEVWTKTFGGTGDDQGNSVQQTSDGGFVITGKTDSFGAGNYDILLIKTDENGNVY
ncbi:MAG: InlB B-repeat-containing protein [Chitinispirillaceae bacterium]|nr:InlB B-repeat-containing protein [Chitinispirillaceae bacterium]